MPERDYFLFAEDILEAARKIQRYVQEHSRLLSGDARFRRTGLSPAGR